MDLDSQRQGKCVVLKTSTRQTIFLPVVGLVDADALKPGDLVGVNKDRWVSQVHLHSASWSNTGTMMHVAPRMLISPFAGGYYHTYSIHQFVALPHRVLQNQRDRLEVTGSSGGMGLLSGKRVSSTRNT